MNLRELNSLVADLQNLLTISNDYVKAEEQAHLLMQDYIKIKGKTKKNANILIEIEVKILLILSQSLALRGLAKEALPYIEKAHSIVERLQNKKLQSIVFSNIGLIYRELSDCSKSLEYYRRALLLDEELDDKEGVASNLGSIGNVYWSVSEFGRALEYHHKALAVSEQIDDKSKILGSLINIGLVYNNISDYDSALKHFSNALEINEKFGQKLHTAVLLANIGNTYTGLSDHQSALHYYRQALIVNQELGIQSNIAVILDNIGGVYKNLSDYINSLDYYRQALELNERLGRKRGIANNLGNIGSVYDDISDYESALHYYRQALALNRELGTRSHEVINLGNIGNVYRETSDYESALYYYRQALALNRELGVTSGAAINLGNIGILYTKKDFVKYNPTLAEKYLLQAISTIDERGTKLYLYQFYKALSILYKQECRWEEYAEYIEKYYDTEKEVQSIEVKKQADRFDLVRQIMEKEKARAIAARDGEIQRLRAEELTRNIALMKKELEELIERLVRKSQFIRSISGKLEYAMSLTNGESRRAVYSVIELLDDRVGDEEDRIVVLLQLRAVYGDFMNRLSSCNKELNDGEIKTCALMLMHLSTSKISITLGVSERTVEKYRSTIRKKLGIAAHGNIVAFLQQFLEE